MAKVTQVAVFASQNGPGLQITTLAEDEVTVLYGPINVRLDAVKCRVLAQTLLTIAQAAEAGVNVEVGATVCSDE